MIEKSESLTVLLQKIPYKDTRLYAENVKVIYLSKLIEFLIELQNFKDSEIDVRKKKQSKTVVSALKCTLLTEEELRTGCNYIFICI